MKIILICIYLAYDSIIPTMRFRLLEEGEKCAELSKEYVTRAVGGQAWAICAKARTKRS